MYSSVAEYYTAGYHSSVWSMATSLPCPPPIMPVNSAGPSSLKSLINGLTRPSKTARYAGPSRSRRPGRAQQDIRTQGYSANSCKTRCPSYRVEPAKDDTFSDSPVEIPSGSVDTTTVSRRTAGPSLLSECNNSHPLPTAKDTR